MIYGRLDFVTFDVVERCLQGAAVGGIDAYYRRRSVWKTAFKVAVLFAAAELYKQTTRVFLTRIPNISPFAFLLPKLLELSFLGMMLFFESRRDNISPATAAMSFSAKAVGVLKHISISCYLAAKPVRALVTT